MRKNTLPIERQNKKRPTTHHELSAKGMGSVDKKDTRYKRGHKTSE